MAASLNTVSLEAGTFSKSKNLYKNSAKLPKIGRVFVQVLNEFLHILKTSMDDHVFKQFMYEFLLFWPLKTLWQLPFLASEDIMAASVNILRGRTIHGSF